MKFVFSIIYFGLTCSWGFYLENKFEFSPIFYFSAGAGTIFLYVFLVQIVDIINHFKEKD